jgi:hypothetical protein
MSGKVAPSNTVCGAISAAARPHCQAVAAPALAKAGSTVAWL